MRLALGSNFFHYTVCVYLDLSASLLDTHPPMHTHAHITHVHTHIASLLSGAANDLKHPRRFE